MAKYIKNQEKATHKTRYKARHCIFLMLSILLVVAILPLINASLSDGLISYYALDNITGNVTDSFGSNEGTNYGATRGITGKINNSFSFDGNNDRVDLGDIDTGSNFSLSIWFKDGGSTAQQDFLMKKILYNDNDGFYLQWDGRVGYKRFSLRGSSSGVGGKVGLSNINTITDTNWHHVVVLFIGTSANYFVDNVNVTNSTEQDIVAVIDNDKDFEIGGDTTLSYLNATLDEFGIWNRTLNSTEISDLYNNGNGFNPTTPITPIWWDSSWKKRIHINGITENISYINISYEPEMNSNFNDLRFINEAQDTELEYYLQDKNDSAWAVFRINTNGENISMYYNNSEASSNSNINDIYGNDLVAVYFLDKESGVAVDSLSVNNGSVTGATRGVDGKISNAFSFDGSDYVTLNTNVGDFGTDNYTVSAWFKRTNTDGDNYIVSKRDTASPYKGWFIVDLAGGGILAGQVGSPYLFSYTNRSDNEWHFAVLTRNGATGYLYIDNVLQNSSTFNADSESSASTTSIGSRKGADKMYVGQIDEVILWNRSLTSTEIKAFYEMDEPNVSFSSVENYTATWTLGLSAGLVSYYKFDEQDTTGTGTILDSLEINNGINNQSTNTAGKINTAYLYDGTGNRIDWDSYGIADGDFTISMWVYWNDIARVGYANVGFLLVSYEDPTNNAFIQIYTSSSALTMRMRDNSGGGITSVLTGTLLNNQWYNLVFVYNNGTKEMKIYVNDTTSYTNTFGGGSFSLIDTTLIGSNTNSANPFSGKIDEVGIWNRILNDSEIAQLYNSGAGITYTPLAVSQITVELISPLNNSIISYYTTGINFTANYSVEGYNLTNATYYIWYSNGTLFNSTSVDVTGNVSNSTTLYIDNFTPLTYKWNVYACGDNATGSKCEWDTNNFTFIYDEASLTVELISPSNDSIIYYTTGINFTANYSVEGYNLTNATYYIWEDDVEFNSTSIDVTGNVSNSTTLYINNFTPATYEWNVYACGDNATGSKCEWNTNNFTFIYYNFSLCYQETANVSTECGGLDGGNYSWWGSWQDIENVFDGNWSTLGRGTNIGEINITYEKPIGARNDSLWQVKNDFTIKNLTIDSSCWDYDANYLYLKVYSDAIFSFITYCFNGTGYIQLYHQSHSLYEEAMWWKIEEDSIAPQIFITSPLNQTYNTTNITLDWYAIEENPDSAFYSINGTTNVSININQSVNLTFAEGQNNLTIWMNDTVGNENSTIVYFTVDSIAPQIFITSPLNQTYNTTNINLSWYAIEENPDSAFYSINGTANVSINVFTNISECYQETANVSTECGGLDGGNYSWSGSWTNVENVFDGNWSTFGRGDIGEINIIYEKLIDATNNSLWQVKTGDEFINLTIDSSCWDYDIDYLYLKAKSWWAFEEGQFYCFNGTNYIELLYFYSSHIYEEAMWWEIEAVNLTFAEGQNNLTIWMNDTVGNENSTIVYFTIESIPFNITLIYPLNQTYNESTFVEQINWTLTGSYEACWYGYGGINTTMNCTENYANFIYNGNNTITVYANDSLGFLISDNVTFAVVDDIPPSGESGGYDGSGTSPSNNTFTNISETNFTINASDDSGIDNITLFILNETDDIINQTTIDTGGSTNIFLGIIYYLWYEGIYKWYFKVVDTIGNLLTTTEAIITYDITAPSGAILYPLNTSYNHSVVEMNVSIIEANPNNCWYNVNGTNVSETCGVNITGINSTEGINTWYYWVNDSVGYINESSVTFTQDTINPIITIYSPIATTYGISEFLVNISTDEPSTYIWYSYDNGTTNTTYTSEIIEDVNDGEYDLTFYVWANDSANNIGTAQVNLSIDTIYPVAILYPISNYSTNNLTSSFNISYNITNGGNLTSCWYIVDGNYSSDEFNNSLTEENLTFISEGNITRWLEVPENSTNLISTYLNLSGFEYSIFKDVDYEGYASSPLGVTNNRIGIEFNITQIKIDNISFVMAEETNPAGNIFITFRNITDDSLIYEKDFGTVLGIIPENFEWVNFNISDSPLIEEPIYILVERNVSEVDAVRFITSIYLNQDTFDNIRTVRYNKSIYIPTGFGNYDDPPMIIVYEEGYGYVNNASISINGTQIWNYIGKFNQTNNRTSNFASTVNSYLSNCSIVNGSCFVPFLFHSDTAGTFQYSNLIFSDGLGGDLNCSANDETITIISDGFHELTIYGEDGAGLVGNDSDDFYVLYHEYTQPVAESIVAEGEVIEFNLTVEVTDINRVTDMTAVLVYDGTDYPIDSFAILDDGYFFDKELSIPKGIGNTTGKDINWSWRYSIEGNSYWVGNFSTDNVSQTVFSVEIDNCSTYNETILNLYQLNDEETDTLMNNTLNPRIEVDLNLTSLGDSGLSWNFYTIFENSTSGSICVPNYLLNYSDYRLDIVIGYVADTYVQEFWYLDAGIISQNVSELDDYTSRNITLRDLLLIDSTTFLFKYHDESFRIHPSAIVILQRYYIGDGEFREVERCKLDNNGECHLHLVEEDVIYKFIIIENGELEFESSEYNAKCVDIPCSISLGEGVTIPEPETEFDRLDEGTYNIDSNSINRTVTLSFSLTSTGTMDLEVYTYDNNGIDDNLIISDSATAKSGEIEVNVPLSYENYTYYAVARHDGEFLSSKWIDMNEKGFNYFGTFGLFLAVLLILTLGLIAVTSGAWTIVFIILGLIVASITKLIDMGYYSLIWIICLGLLIIYKLSHRRIT